MLSAHERYSNDPVFRAMVDQMQYVLAGGEAHGKQITASELREAVLLASELYEARHVRPLLLYRGLDPFGGASLYAEKMPSTSRFHRFGPERAYVNYAHRVAHCSKYQVCMKCGLSTTYIDAFAKGEECRS